MSDPPSYFWKDDQVVIFDHNSSQKVFDEYGLLHSLCVDPFFDDPKLRYGRVTKIDGKWTHVPLDQFPAEFRTQLLLLGVT